MAKPREQSENSSRDENLNTPETISSSEAEEYNFETQVIPDTWNRVEGALKEIQENLDTDEYSDDIWRLGSMIHSHNPEIEEAIYKNNDQEEELKAKEILERVFDEEQVETIVLDYRQRYREALVLVMESIRSSDDVSTEGERNARGKAVLEVVSFLSSRGDDTERLEDKFSEDQVEVLEKYREVLRTSSVDYAKKFVDESGRPAEDFDDRISAERKKRQEQVLNFVRELSPYSKGERPWKPEEQLEVSETLLSKEEYKAKIKEYYSNWQEKVDQEGGIVMNTQGFTAGGKEQRDLTPGFLGMKRDRSVEAPQVFFMEDQYVRVPETISDSGKEELVKVSVSRTAFSEIRSRGDDMNLGIGESSTLEGYYHQPIYTMDCSSNSVVKAQELLWQLECHERQNGLYMVPVKRQGKACWLPLEDWQFKLWRKNLEKTVDSFSKKGLTYEKVKREDTRRSSESGGEFASFIENGVSDIERDVEYSWYMGQLQLSALEDSFEFIEEAGVLDRVGQEREKNLRESVKDEYLDFLSVYGRRSEYISLAKENLVSRGIDPEDNPDLLENEVIKIISNFEIKKRMLNRFASGKLEVIDYLRSHPEEIPDRLEELEKLFEQYKEGLGYVEQGQTPEQEEEDEDTNQEEDQDSESQTSTDSSNDRSDDKGSIYSLGPPPDEPEGSSEDTEDHESSNEGRDSTSEEDQETGSQETPREEKGEEEPDWVPSGLGDILDEEAKRSGSDSEQ